MKLAVLYRSKSEQERKVLELQHDYNHVTGRQLSLMDVNTRDGWSMASLYDVVQYPAVLATTDDGQLVQLWTGEHLPLMNEIMYYDHV